VGALIAEGARNVIPESAILKAEVRGGTTEVNDFLENEAFRVIRCVAALHNVEAEIAIVGKAITADCDQPLKEQIAQAAKTLESINDVADSTVASGSEDATVMMRAVQATGGQATYLRVGADLVGDYHQSNFDFDESSLGNGVHLYLSTARRLLLT
jgi:aminobenzoyl-glutamate utilization protein A